MTGMGWDVIGHAWAVELLRRQMERGTLHHAYLITGPAGVGRRSLATALAQAVLCLAPPAPGDACGACRACRQVPAGTYPDLHLVERPEDKRGIGIEQIRDLQRSLALTPLDGKARVAVLIDFNDASEGAANALLKTLEEPPPRVYLVLTASDVEDVPATIASRCEALALRLVPEADIAAALERRGASPESARVVAKMAVGRPVLGIELLEDPAKRERRAGHAAALPQAMRLDLPGRFALAEEWSDEEDLDDRLSTWLLLLGGAVRSTAGQVSSEEQRSTRRAIDAVVGTLEALRRNANARLALETMMLDLPPASEVRLSADAQGDKPLDS
jgi:DNA polymerase-3 subunit delta'